MSSYEVSLFQQQCLSKKGALFFFGADHGLFFPQKILALQFDLCILGLQKQNWVLPKGSEIQRWEKENL